MTTGARSPIARFAPVDIFLFRRPARVDRSRNGTFQYVTPATSTY
jgi:hypothetical protein